MADCVSAKQSLATNIKSNRLSKGWSQAKLAELIGVNSASTIGNWEAALAAPDYDKLCFLADLFEVTTDQLLGRNTHVNEISNQSDNNIIDIDNHNILIRYECCDDIGRDAIENCIQFHYNRCTSNPTAKAKNNSNAKREKLFINENDAEYDVMCQQMTYLKTLRKNRKKGYVDITRYLWDCGYGDEICLAFVLNMFGIGATKRVPCPKLYDDVKAFLMGNYKVVTNVKNV